MTSAASSRRREDGEGRNRHILQSDTRGVQAEPFQVAHILSDGRAEVLREQEEQRRHELQRNRQQSVRPFESRPLGSAHQRVEEDGGSLCLSKELSKAEEEKLSIFGDELIEYVAKSRETHRK